VMVMGNSKDERTFSIVIFMKSKLHNCLIVHLDLVVKMYAQKLLQAWDLSFLHNNVKVGEREITLWRVVGGH
jgi:hypothetical protein